jgi:NADH-quinone oxidoreductase subunit J
VETLTFYIFAAVAIISASMVVLQRRAIYSALSLIVCLGSVAILFFQLGAHFIGAIQIIVYAGAVMVLFLFVIMLLDPDAEIFSRNRLKRLTIIGIPTAVLFALALIATLGSFGAQMPSVAPASEQTTTVIAQTLFREYLLPFEVTSILILIAVIGAIVLTKRPE